MGCIKFAKEQPHCINTDNTEIPKTKSSLYTSSQKALTFTPTSDLSLVSSPLSPSASGSRSSS